MTTGDAHGDPGCGILVVGIVVYRVVWFIEHERRRKPGVVGFKKDHSD